MKTFYLFFIFTCVGFSQYNPNAPWNKNVPKEQLNNFKLEVERAEAYWKITPHEEKGSGYNPYRRWVNHWEHQLNEDGTIFNTQQMQNSLLQKDKLRNEVLNSKNAKMMQSSNWKPVGPIQNALKNNRSRGRVNVIEVDPSNPNIIYIGTPAGGLWKTINGGTNWKPLTDELPQIGVSGIAIDYTNPNIIYIATGDKDSSHSYSIGVLKSTDGGVTWNNTGLNFTERFNLAGDLIIHPTNNQILFCATNTGLYKTSNGGIDWTVQQAGNFAQGSVRFKPSNPSIVYATTNVTFYKSTDTGSTFVAMTNSLTFNNERRTIMDVTPANPEYVYVLQANTDSTLKGIFKSTDSGANFTRVDNGANILEINQAWYDLAFCISRTNPNLISTGCLNIWQSDDGGLSSKKLNDSGIADERFTHADIHFLKYFDNKLFCGSDGGIYVSADDGKTFTDINGDAQTNQFYRISVAKQTSARISGGTQDNGGWALNNNLWYAFHGADGMESGIDPLNQNKIFGFMQRGQNLFISNDGGKTINNIIPSPIGEIGNWVTPMKINNDGEVFVGFTKLYMFKDGGYTMQNPSGGTGTGSIDHIAIDPIDNNIIYVSNQGVLYKSTNKGVNFTEIYQNLRNIERIEVNSTNNSIIYIVTQGVNGEALKSTNGGVTFNTIASGLPSSPLNVIVHQGRNINNPLYLGTEIGVFYTDDTMTSWIPFDTNLPNSPVYDLEINLEDGKLIAGTFGRGVWETSIPIVIPNTDLIFFSAVSPLERVTCNQNEISPKVVVKNNGSSIVNTVTLNYTLNSVPYNYTWNGVINSGEEKAIELPSIPISPNKNEYVIKFVTTTTNDAFVDNNSSRTIKFYSNAIGSAGITNTFTIVEDELIVLNEEKNGWRRGNRDGDELSTNGNTAYLSNLTGNYTNSTKSYLISNCYNLSNTVNPQISFKLAYALEPNWDVVYVEYSTNSGATWNLLGKEGVNWYNSSRTLQLSGGLDCVNCPGGQWTGKNTTLTTYSYPLNDLNTETNIIFRIVFHADSFENDLGVKVDDFVINSVLSSDNFILDRIQVYPIPTNGKLTIDLSDIEVKEIKVFDMLGKKVFESDKNKTYTKSTNIDLSNVSAGVYFIKIDTSERSITKRIIKN